MMVSVKVGSVSSLSINVTVPSPSSSSIPGQFSCSKSDVREIEILVYSVERRGYITLNQGHRRSQVGYGTGFRFAFLHLFSLSWLPSLYFYATFHSSCLGDIHPRRAEYIRKYSFSRWGAWNEIRWKKILQIQVLWSFHVRSQGVRIGGLAFETSVLYREVFWNDWNGSWKFRMFNVWWWRRKKELDGL